MQNHEQEIYSYKKTASHHKKHVIVALMTHKPGVLSRILSLFRKKRFNVDSITAGATEKEGIHKLTFVVDSEKNDVSQVIKQVEKMIDIIEVKDITDEKKVTRELGLIKIAIPEGKKEEIFKTIDIFRGKVVSINKDELITELTGSPEKINEFIENAKEYGVLDISRTGSTTMI